MIFDFQAILFLITMVFGAIWLVGHFFLEKDSNVVEFSRGLFPLLLIVFTLRAFVFEPFRIPSGSMMPTLIKGDFILVKKYAYGLRWPITNKVFFSTSKPERGDVVVFNLPSDPSIKYIKRLVGLPGDKVIYRDKQISINGELIPNKYQSVYKHPRQYGAHVYEEDFAGKKHLMLLVPTKKGLEGQYTVPSDHYFLMGDNRDNSKDSRYSSPGFVSDTYLVGTATKIWFNWDFENTPNWNRVWQTIE